jgi:hypothetical protein
MVYEFGAQETVWHSAYWNGSSWHLPPFYTLVQWIPDPDEQKPQP